jgi:hypothetical protein
MILQDNDTIIEQIGEVKEEAQFKMKASRKAFQILSDLYSDKPLAIVRELGCNASDSMTASGQPDKPFHIHLPNALEPWLTIQDFGTGISHENIYNIYTTYFESTKTNTNSQIGCLGLGSKSPFCYTDNFTITSIHNGEKRIYNAYFNAANMPTISLMSSEKTNDGNGVAIQIPIKSSNFGDFSHAVYKAFRFFDVKPTISGGKIDWEEIKPDFTGSFWKSFHKLNQSFAIMGGVTYPIETYKVDSEHYDILRKAGLVIKFEIGEIDFTPSRESISYCDDTIKAINAKVALVKEDFVTKVEEMVKDSTNILDAMKAYYMLENQWSFLNSKLISGNVRWKGIGISNPRKTIKDRIISLKSYSKKQWGRGKTTISEYASLDNNALWFYDDLKRGGAVNRVIQEVRMSMNPNISINLVDEKDMKTLIQLGFPASVFQLVSSLPAVVTTRKASSGGGNTKPKGVVVVYTKGSGHRDSWESSDHNLGVDATPKYYIVKDGSTFKFDGGTLKGDKGEHILDVNDKGTYQSVVRYLGLQEEDVVLVAKRSGELLEALGSKPFKALVDKQKVTYDANLIEETDLMDVSVIERIAKHSMFSKLSDSNPLKVFILDCKNKLNEVKKVKSIANWIKYSGKGTKKELTFPNHMVELCYQSLASWRVNEGMVLKAALESENKSN